MRRNRSWRLITGIGVLLASTYAVALDNPPTRTALIPTAPPEAPNERGITSRVWDAQQQDFVAQELRWDSPQDNVIVMTYRRGGVVQATQKFTVLADKHVYEATIAGNTWRIERSATEMEPTSTWMRIWINNTEVPSFAGWVLQLSPANYSAAEIDYALVHSPGVAAALSLITNPSLYQMITVESMDLYAAWSELLSRYTGRVSTNGWLWDCFKCGVSGVGWGLSVYAAVAATGPVGGIWLAGHALAVFGVVSSCTTCGVAVNDYLEGKPCLLP